MTDLRDQIAEIVEEAQGAAVHATRNPFIKDDAAPYADRILALFEGERIEGYASQCTSIDPPYDPIPGCWEIVAAAYADDDDRADRRATLILHPETSE